MQKKIIISLISASVLIVGAVYIFNFDSNDTSKIDNTSNTETSLTTSNQENTQSNNDDVNTSEVAEVGKYIDYSEQALAANSTDKRVIFFHAPWCSTCNFFEGQIEDQGVPQDVTILKVDYDNDDATKQKYGVTVQSTFVLIDNSGEIVQSWPFARGLTGIQDLYNQI